MLRGCLSTSSQHTQQQAVLSLIASYAVLLETNRKPDGCVCCYCVFPSFFCLQIIGKLYKRNKEITGSSYTIILVSTQIGCIAIYNRSRMSYTDMFTQSPVGKLAMRLRSNQQHQLNLYKKGCWTPVIYKTVRRGLAAS